MRRSEGYTYYVYVMLYDLESETWYLRDMKNPLNIARFLSLISAFSFKL